MTEAEILALLADNDLKAIRPILSFLAGQTDGDRIFAIQDDQESLRQQLRELRDASSN